MGAAVLTFKFSRETEESRFVHESPDFNNKSKVFYILCQQKKTHLSIMLEMQTFNFFESHVLCLYEGNNNVHFLEWLL